MLKAKAKLKIKTRPKPRLKKKYFVKKWNRRNKSKTRGTQ